MTHSELDLRLVTLQAHPSLEDDFFHVKERVWPPFMMHDAISNDLWHYMREAFPEFTLYLIDSHTKPIACAHAIPITWEGTLEDLPTGWDTAFKRGVNSYEFGIVPDTLCIVEVVTDPDFANRGLTQRILRELLHKARHWGFKALIAPVRPAQKHLYPLTPMARYIRWRNEDGAPFDQTICLHVALGAEIVSVAHPSLRVEGSVTDWEQWTGLAFPESGDYVVPMALAPISIDLDAGIGRYLEPNVWLHYPIATSPLNRRP